MERYLEGQSLVEYETILVVAFPSCLEYLILQDIPQILIFETVSSAIFCVFYITKY